MLIFREVDVGVQWRAGKSTSFACRRFLGSVALFRLDERYTFPSPVLVGCGLLASRRSKQTIGRPNPGTLGAKHPIKGW